MLDAPSRQTPRTAQVVAAPPRRQATPADPCAMVIFGATGDLTMGAHGILGGFKDPVEGDSARSQAKVFQIADPAAVKWMQTFRAEGRTASRPSSDGRASPLAAHAEWLIAQVTTTADATLKELVHEVTAQGIVTSKSAVSRFFLAKGYSKKSVLVEEQLRADVVGAREVWRKAQLDLDPERLVFIDETGCATNMARLRGRGLKGARSHAARQLENHYFRGGPASPRTDCAHGDGRAR